jgi:hypothetical protein
MEIIKVNNINEFIKIIETHKFVNEDSLYRGHNNFEWELVPKIARSNFQFRTHNDTEEKMLETFKRHSNQFLNKELKNNWDYLVIAQHYGMATRLLDWIKNPLAALWFCVNKSPDKIEYGSVWILKVEDGYFLKASEIDDEIKKRPKYFETAYDASVKSYQFDSPFKIDNSIVVYQPHLLDNRVINQNGWFTVHGLDKNNQYLKLSTEQSFKDKIVQILIPTSCFSEIRATLDTLGVNQLTLFPDLASAATYSEWLHTTQDDELFEE